MASYHELFVHIVWATYERLPLIEDRFEKRLFALLAAKCKEMSCEPLAIGGIADHVHALAQMSSAVSVADLTALMKGSSAHFVNHELRIDNTFKWQRGYGAFTVSKRGADRIKEYVRNQKSRHAGGSIIQAFERTGDDTGTA